MVPEGGRNRTTVSQKLLARPFRFDFFQAVRMLEWMARKQVHPATLGRRYPVGGDHSPKQEVVRFRALPSHSFPAGAISEIRRPGKGSPSEQDQSPPEMIVTLMGLTGPSGVLPHHYTSLLIERIREKDYALRDFLDLFNHRTISLFYRAWEKYRFPISYERSKFSATADQEDLFTRCLYCLVGLGTGGLGRRMQFDDEALLFYAGHFAHRPRSAISLERILCDYFELPVKVKQFQGQWLYLNEADRSLLAGPKHPQGRNNQLGVNLVIGQRVWDVESKFRVQLGPLTYGQFRRFMPSGDALGPLCQMVRFYVGAQFDLDVQPMLKAKEVPWCRLGGDRHPPGPDPSRLGWNTWIRAREFEHDVDDAIFRGEA